MTEGAILGLAQAGASAANTAGDFLSNAIFGRRNERWARQDATTAFNRQQQLLAEQRAYESPAAQMQRYIDAGLHPGLIYGQQQGSIAPPSVPQAASSNVAPPSMSLDASGLINSRLAEAQIRNLDSEARNRDKMTDGQLRRWMHENNVSDVTVDELRSVISVNEARISEINASADKMKAEFDVFKEDKRAKVLENYITEHTMKMTIDARNKQSEAVIKTALALALANVANVKSETALNYAQAALARQNVNLSKEQEKQARALAKLYNTQIVGQQYENQTARERLSQIRAITAQMFPGEDAGWYAKLNGRLVRDFYTMKEINPFSIGINLK